MQSCILHWNIFPYWQALMISRPGLAPSSSNFCDQTAIFWISEFSRWCYWHGTFWGGVFSWPPRSLTNTSTTKASHSKMCKTWHISGMSKRVRYQNSSSNVGVKLGYRPAHRPSWYVGQRRGNVADEAGSCATLGKAAALTSDWPSCSHAL